MSMQFDAPWHAESYHNFLHMRLPELLAERLPLGGYAVEADGEDNCRIRLSLQTPAGEVAVSYDGIPLPAASGLFSINDVPTVVVPLASSEQLDTAEVRCVGEQLYGFIAERLGLAPTGMVWDDALLRAWLPLDAWVGEFFAAHGQRQDTTNWLAAQTHLRRVFVPEYQHVIAPGQFGRTCPFEVPEGPNIGRIFSLALGADIRDGRINITDQRPEAGLGLTASMIPLLEHDDPNRLLMGANMMRQWVIPPDAEPALVQTGNEPAAPGYWCGRNLLTAFVSWGAGTYEDGMIISESCAQRLNYPHATEPGDKLSNRHGAKGVISRILPDAEMPHLPDGTPVELVYNFIALHTRLNFGQEREALLSRIAQAEKSPIVAPPFHGPNAGELHARLTNAHLPADGMETLRQGRDGTPLQRRSLVGWVYWGKTVHLARYKMQLVEQKQGEREYHVLRDNGAWENLLETFNTRSERNPESATLAARLAVEPVVQAAPPTPIFRELAERLAAAGICMELDDERVTFALAASGGAVLRLAAPVAHPWLLNQELVEIGEYPQLPEYAVVAEANVRLARMLQSGAPEGLLQQAQARLAEVVATFFDALVTAEQLQFDTRVRFSAHSVIIPGEGLQNDQLGLPEEIAWAFFRPLVVREVGDSEAEQRSSRAVAALDAIMAHSWVIANRAPSILPTSLLAFHPVRRPGKAISLPPLACMLINADFDGDQISVFLPVTDAGQREAEELLSVVGHLRRDPALVQWLFPNQESLWGLAWLGLTAEGRAHIVQETGIEIGTQNGLITRATVLSALRGLLARDGADRMLEASERLLRLGFTAAQQSGASISPFFGEGLPKLPQPDNADPDAWVAYTECYIEQLVTRTDYENDEYGAQLLAVKSEARGNMKQLAVLHAGRLNHLFGQFAPMRHGFAEGVTPAEMFNATVGAREGLASITLENLHQGYGIRTAERTGGLTVFARARRAQHPGIIFANAAAIGETDPLADVDTRLFVGLLPQS
ncbi:MAG: hypothetical protein WCJ56_08190 [bacterium]